MLEDAFSSGRGAGFFGTLIGLVVLLGFGTLYVLVIDEGFLGQGKTIEHIVKTQDDEIKNLTSNITALTKSEKDIVKGKAVKVEFDSATKQFDRLKKNYDAESPQVGVLENEIATIHQNWEKYRDKYHIAEAKRAIGEVLPSLVTKDGNEFKNAKILEVTAKDIKVQAQGLTPKRIPLANMPDELVDRFQMTTEKAKIAQDLENKETGVHWVNAEIGRLKIRIGECNSEIKKRVDTIYNNKQTVISDKLDIDKLDREINKLDVLISQYTGKGIDRRQQYRAQQNAKRAAQQALRSKQQELNAKNMALESEISTYKNEVAGCEKRIKEILIQEEQKQKLGEK